MPLIINHGISIIVLLTFKISSVTYLQKISDFIKSVNLCDLSSTLVQSAYTTHGHSQVLFY